MKEDIPENSNILSARFIVTIKSFETDNHIYKAQYVMNGHKGKEKSQLIQNSTTLR